VTNFPVLVTFGIPTYNSPYLEAAVRSALSQTLSGIEVIVSDDGRRPESKALVERIGDARVRYFQTEGQPGVPANWNRCLRLACGKYFVLLPDDDVVAPEFAARMVAALENRPEAGFAQCGLLAVDAQARVFYDRLVAPPADFLSGHDALAWQLETLKCNPVAVMFRREVLEQFGGWQEHFWDDWSVILRIAFRRGFVFVRESLASNRSHGGNLSKTMAREGRDEVLDLINQQAAVFGDSLPATPELLALRARWNRDVSHRAMIKVVKSLFQGHLKAAAFHFRRARALYPLAGFHPGFIVVALQTKIHTIRMLLLTLPGQQRGQ
jgi:glycosyltransferase involved in cell wall biosynthesis